MKPSTPRFWTSSARSTDSAVQLPPTFAMTGALPSAASTTALNRAIFSARVSVGLSPVVPLMMSESEPPSIRRTTSFCAVSRSSLRSESNGVIIAGIKRPKRGLGILAPLDTAKACALVSANWLIIS